MTKIYLIRHGEAEGNIFRRLHGQYDSLLTPRGHRQVACLRKRFENIPIDGCFASDLTRACLTARAIYVPKGLTLHRDKRFREVDVGIWEDIPYGYLDNFETEGMSLFTNDPPAWFVEGGETFDEYTSRFLAGLAEAAEQFDGGTIAVVAHGAAIRSTLMRLFFMEDLSKLPFSDNTGVSLLQYDNGNFSYDFLNDNSHIPEELSTFHIQRWWRETGRRKEAAVYFRPLEESSDGIVLSAILIDREVGRLAMGAPQGDTAVVLSMSLKNELDGRYYGDQLLGEAFSRARISGCRNLRLTPGYYPDNIVERYEFDPDTLTRCIDPHMYCWEETKC